MQVESKTMRDVEIFWKLCITCRIKERFVTMYITYDYIVQF